jgi:hypothetical protein
VDRRTIRIKPSELGKLVNREQTAVTEKDVLGSPLPGECNWLAKQRVRIHKSRSGVATKVNISDIALEGTRVLSPSCPTAVSGVI